MNAVPLHPALVHLPLGLAAVESLVPESAIEQHEEFGLASLVPVSRRQPLTRTLVAASLAGTIVVAVLAVQVCHAGGRLVYVHNAGGRTGTSNRELEIEILDPQFREGVTGCSSK